MTRHVAPLLSARKQREQSGRAFSLLERCRGSSRSGGPAHEPDHHDSLPPRCEPSLPSSATANTQRPTWGNASLILSSRSARATSPAKRVFREAQGAAARPRGLPAPLNGLLSTPPKAVNVFASAIVDAELDREIDFPPRLDEDFAMKTPSVSSSKFGTVRLSTPSRNSRRMQLCLRKRRASCWPTAPSCVFTAASRPCRFQERLGASRSLGADL